MRVNRFMAAASGIENKCLTVWCPVAPIIPSVRQCEVTQVADASPTGVEVRNVHRGMPRHLGVHELLAIGRDAGRIHTESGPMCRRSRLLYHSSSAQIVLWGPEVARLGA